MEKETAIYSSMLAWEIPWIVEPGRLQSMGSQRFRYDLVTEQKQQFINGISLVVQWLRIHLPMQEMRVQSLGQGDAL